MARQKLKIALWIALACTHTTCTANEPAIQVLRSSPKAQCDFNTLLPSANGAYFSVYRSNARFQDAPAFRQPDWFVVYSTVPNDGSTSDRIELKPAIVGGLPVRFRPLAWQAGTLTFRVGPDRLGSYTPASGAAIEINSLPAVWADFEIHILNSSKISILFDPVLIDSARSISMNRNYLRRTVYVSDSPLFSVVEQRSGQTLKIGRRNHNLKKIGSASFYNHFRILEISKKTTISYLGLESKKIPKIISDYSRAFFDYSNGRFGGLFKPNMVRGVFSEDRINNLIKRRNFLIRDAAISGEKLFLLVDNDVNISVLTFNATTGDISSEVQICQIDAALLALFPNLKDQIERGPRSHFLQIGLQLSPHSKTTGVLVKDKPSNSDRLVVYFHGGPAESANPYELGRDKRALLDEGFDLLMVDYSGSVGGGLALSRGLRDDVSSGFKRDAEAIHEWLKGQNYESVHLYAVSFGTLPALVLATEFPTKFDKKVFVSPLLHYPGAKSLENSRELLDRTVVGGQKDFEMGVFGGESGRQRYTKFIEEMSSSYRPDLRDLFVFGSADRKTPMKSAPKSILEAANIYEIEGVGHAFLPSDEKTIKRVRCHLIDDCDVTR